MNTWRADALKAAERARNGHRVSYSTGRDLEQASLKAARWQCSCGGRGEGAGEAALRHIDEAVVNAVVPVIAAAFGGAL